MITGTMYWKRMTLELKGHAGYAEKGKDIVCAGASALTDALAVVLEEAEARGRTTADVKGKDGTVTISADPGMGSVNEIKAYFRFCVKGMKNLQQQYPEYLTMKEVF